MTTTTAPEPLTFTARQVLDAGEHGLRDGIDVMVNATFVRPRGEAFGLRDVADSSYREGIDTIPGWSGEA